MSEVNISITEINENIAVSSEQTVEEISIQVQELGDTVQLNVDEVNEVVQIDVIEANESINLMATEQVTLVDISVAEAEELIQVAINEGPEGPQGPPGTVEDTFETISKNIKAYPFTIEYFEGNPIRIIYDLGGDESVIKTFGYTDELLTSITLSGNVPNGITLIKNLNYSQGNLVGVSYN